MNLKYTLRRYVPLSLLLSTACILSACKEETDPPVDSVGEFQVVARHPGAALMAVHGSSASNIWAVGADDAEGPFILRFDGDSLARVPSDYVGDLWWVQALAEDDVYFAGSDAHLLHYDGESVTRLSTPGLGKHIVFGVWAARADDLYAVGAVAGRNGFIWHYDGETFSEIELPEELIQEDSDLPPLFKVAGRTLSSDPNEDDVWIVGGNGTILRGNHLSGFQVVESPTSERLFTVHVNQKEALIVGGGSAGIALSAKLEENASAAPQLQEIAPADAPLLQGAFAQASAADWMSGRRLSLFRVDEAGSESVELDLEDQPQFIRDAESFHGLYVDPEGHVWAAGGNVLSPSLDAGLLLTNHPQIETWDAPTIDPETLYACPAGEVDPKPQGSIARRWNEQLLGAIRRDTPRPTVHARNLLHSSMAMWDAWAAFEGDKEGIFEQDSQGNAGGAGGGSASGDEAQEIAISYAAYRVLHHRYKNAAGGKVSENCFNAFMEKLGLDPEFTSTEGQSAAALGNRIAEKIISHYANDGAREEANYMPETAVHADNPVLVVDLPGTVVDDPSAWQQLLLSEAVTQNGIPEGSGVRDYVGPHWGEVTPFALERAAADQPYFLGDNPPTQMNADLIAAAVDVIEKTAALDINDGELMDISPAGYGNNSLGLNDGQGRMLNPKTGQPYTPEMVLRGDFTRILAEFWADGPASETPPGHWNTLANKMADHPENSHQLFGTGPSLDRLAWDVHIYLALNGALHDAAIAAWELKRYYESARPITLIRYLSGLGQSSDPNQPSYHAEGLPLIDGLIEVITEESSQKGERHEALHRYVGEIALLSWRGEPGDRKSEIGGVDWIRGVEWIPYQRRTFVTPAFPGYVSGHSTFSRAAAEALTLLTGDEYFPGGLASYPLEPGYLFFEYGPTDSVELQWATYYDAADQAGQSRLYGGIHIRNDDFDGRKVGAQVGALAVQKAQEYF